MAEHPDQVFERRLGFSPSLLVHVCRRLEEGPLKRDRAGADAGEAASQQIEAEREAAFLHPGAERTKLASGFGPQAAYMGDRQVRLRQRRTGAIHPVEDADNFVDVIVVAGDVIDGVGVVPDRVQVGQRGEVVLQGGTLLLLQSRELAKKVAQASPKEVVDADPSRIFQHQRPLVEAEFLGLHVEVEVEEQGFGFVERRRLALEEGVKRGQPLLTVKQKKGASLLRRLGAAHLGRLVGLPEQQVPGRVAPVHRLHQPAHLVAVPDIAALELRQEDLAAVDLGQQFVDLSRVRHSGLHPPAARPLPRRTGPSRVGSPVAPPVGRGAQFLDIEKSSTSR